MSSEADPAQEQLLAHLQKLIDYIEGVYRALLNRPPSLAETETT